MCCGLSSDAGRERVTVSTFFFPANEKVIEPPLRREVPFHNPLETGARENFTIDTMMRYAQALGKRLVLSVVDEK